eukprot:8498916-Karenia_brevis.AAC.1
MREAALEARNQLLAQNGSMHTRDALLTTVARAVAWVAPDAFSDEVARTRHEVLRAQAEDGAQN